MIAGYVLVAIVGAGLIIGTNTVQVGYSGWVGSPGNSDCRTSMTSKYLTSPFFHICVKYVVQYEKKSRLGKAVTGDLYCKVN
jgi:hypothetical protein